MFIIFDPISFHNCENS